MLPLIQVQLQHFAHTILAEELFEKWKTDGERDYKLFDGSIMKCGIMKRAVELEKDNGETITLRLISFIDKRLPFTDYFPKNGDLPLHVDIVIGGDVAWQYLLKADQSR